MSFKGFVPILVISLFLLLGTASAFEDTFSTWGTLEEAGSMATSTSSSWWVNSGGRLELRGGYARTIQGDLPSGDRWRIAYAAADPTDTDGGYRPQNIFRLVTRSTWRNVRQGFYFRVRGTDLSDSPNRAGSNGILIFSRYQDSQNLYYAGVRVDGTAVVKKKSRGSYYLLGQTKILSGSYDRWRSPNLLPLNRRIGLKTRTTTQSGGSVLIEVFWNLLDGRGWQRLLQAVDTGASGGPPIGAAGFGGIRTDFMDVEFDTFVAAPLS